MRRKTPKIVLTFPRTAAASAFETHAQAQGLPGRMIPVPSVLSAGCGLAWCADVSCREDLERAAENATLEVESINVVDLY